MPASLVAAPPYAMAAESVTAAPPPRGSEREGGERRGKERRGEERRRKEREGEERRGEERRGGEAERSVWSDDAGRHVRTTHTPEHLCFVEDLIVLLVPGGADPGDPPLQICARGGGSAVDVGVH